MLQGDPIVMLAGQAAIIPYDWWAGGAMAQVVDYRTLVGSNPEKMYKATVYESPKLLLGLSCLEPGQSDRAHTHADQDKFYFVVEGEGEFQVGEETVRAGAGVT